MIKGIKLISCKCKSPWCESGWCRGQAVSRLFAGGRTGQIEDWDWRRVRHVVVTVDRELFEDGEKAYLGLKSRIGYFGQRLRSMLDDVGVVDYVKVLEWHGDGWPHWHYLVLTDVAGRGGQLGYEVLSGVWGRGRVMESYVRSAEHWRRLVGYQAKQGYMGGSKGHQVTLPEWALNWKSGSIRKGSRALVRRNEDERGNSEGDGEKRKERRTYRALISHCGEESKMVDMDRPGRVYKLPWAAKEVREVILPGLKESGEIEDYVWSANCGFVVFYRVPVGIPMGYRALDYLFGMMVAWLSEQTGVSVERGELEGVG